MDLDNMLMMGIEVLVCLVGKKIEWFFLLFGGECLFVVVVLLVVIFKVWLSLFYIFDEVEVVFDDVNLGCLFMVFE